MACDYEGQVNRLLTSPNILPEQRQVLTEYDRDAKLNRNDSPKTRQNRMILLVKLAEHVKKPFMEMTADDLKDFIYSRQVSPASKDAYKAIIQKFYKWHYNTDDKPDVVKWMRKGSNTKKKLPDDLLSLDEIKDLINVSDNPRDAALIAIFYDAGGRLGEILGLKQKDVKTDEYGFYIMVNGKTGQRRIRLTISAPYIKALLNNHPHKGHNNPLFTGRQGREISHTHCRTTFRKVAKRAGIEKNIHPHLFRHTRMTHLASDLTEQQLKVFAGWTGGSRMPGTYVHLSGADVDSKILEIAGMKDPAERKREDETLKPRECPRCSEINAVTNIYCYKCGMPLTKTAIDEKENAVNELWEGLKAHPEILLELAGMKKS